MILANRSEFCNLINDMNLKIGIELGVAAGNFSNYLLTHSSIETLYSIDRWSDHHDETEYKSAKLLLSNHGSRSIIIQSSFHEALPSFSDNSIDFIYIDGYAHTGQENGETLNEWFIKLSSGGIFSGHDYHDVWMPTKTTVDTFCLQYNLKLNVTLQYPDPLGNYPSWWLIKPHL